MNTGKTKAPDDLLWSPALARLWVEVPAFVVAVDALTVAIPALRVGPMAVAVRAVVAAA
jgi:hypothetical protein